MSVSLRTFLADARERFGPPVVERRIVVGEELLDPVYRHVNHDDLVSLIEEGRLALLERAGFPNRSLGERGVLIVVSELEVRYLREVGAGEVVATCSQLLEDGEGGISCFQELLAPKVAVAAVVSLAVIDASRRRRMRLPSEVLAAVRALRESGHSLA